MTRPAQRTAQRRAERKECSMHGYQRHGKEAQELRDGIEEALDNHNVDVSELSGDVARDTLASLQECLRNLLENVDARDSLAYLERAAHRVTEGGGT